MCLFFNSNKMSPEQMAQIRTGLASGLTRRQVSIYARPEFTPEQMVEIRLGLSEGLVDAGIRAYAHPSISAEDMRKMRCIIRNASDIDNEMKQLDRDFKKVEKHRKDLFER